MLIGKIYRGLQYRFIKKTFSLWERLGYHLTRNHFYEPIPDTRTLPKTLWENPSAMVGIDINEPRQLELLGKFQSQFKQEYSNFPSKRTVNANQYYTDNGYFESVDGEILYCMVRHFKPRQILEIGSGFSTCVSSEAIERNKQDDASYQCDLTAIEPYPSKVLTSGIKNLSKIVQSGVQSVPLATFEKLQANDILFIDSSHILKIGSDVQYEFLEILPRLQKGVVIHVHDIFLPAEYSRDTILKEHNFFNEQYLLQAFLTFNNQFEVLWAGSYMHLTHPEALEKAFPSYSRKDKWPGSFWLRRTQ